MEEVLNEPIKKKRIDWIDIAKFIGIFFIVMAHVRNNGSIRSMITYAVPFFFFLSGLTFSKKDNKQFIKSKIKSLYIPYLIDSSVSIFIYLLLGKYVGENVGFTKECIFENIFGMIYGNAALGNMMWNRPIWFLPTLFILSIIVNNIEKIKNKKLRYSIVIVLTAIGMILGHFNINLPLHTETALSMLIWIYSGMITKNIFLKIENKKLITLIIMIISMAIGVIAGGINGAISIITDGYGRNIILYFIASVAWIIALTMISILISKNKLLQYVGRNTLIILLIHKFPILFFQKICSVINNLIFKDNFIISLLTTVVISICVIAMCLVFDMFLKKFLKTIKEFKQKREQLNL